MAEQPPLPHQPFHRNELFRLLVDAVEDYAIFVLDPTGHVLTWNAGAQRMNQYSEREIVGKHFSIFYPPADLALNKPAEQLQATIRKGRFETEGWRLRQDGTPFWASVVLTALYDDSGTLQGFAKVTRDLTERRAADERLRQGEMRLHLLIESIRDYAVFMLEPDGRVATWNSGAERIKGYRAEEIIGRHFSVFYPESDVRAGKCEMELRVAASQGRFEDEGWRIRQDGTRFWANVVISAVRNDGGTLLGFSKVTRDLTERRQSEEERTARLAAERANRTKDEFLAMLGHELRNPLAPIVTGLQLMKMRGAGLVTREHQIIERQVQHMVRLVDDLLDISRITRGDLTLRKGRHDLRALVTTALEATTPLLEERRQHVRMESSEAPILVEGDEARLVQVFANLLTNAAKYSDPERQITVAISVAEEQAIVEVHDQGMGISPELLPTIFDLFVQAPQGIARSRGGLGVGLALVRRLLALHGGSVEGRSPGLGMGSTFTVRMPVVQAPDSVLAQDEGSTVGSSPASTPQRVLLVSDNVGALDLLADTLRARGHEVRLAPDAVAAMAALQAFEPEIAILELSLPIVDGYQLAAQVRAKCGDAMRIIAVAGYGQAIDPARIRAAGFDAHLEKPVSHADVIACLGHARAR